MSIDKIGPQIPPKKAEEMKGKKETERTEPAKKAETAKGGEKSDVSMARLDSAALAGRLAAMAAKYKEKEISKPFADIVSEVLHKSGLTDPQAAFEKVNKMLQEEIEETLENIKNNKELMETAHAWENFSDLLSSNLTKDQLEELIATFESAINNKDYLA